VKAPQPLIAVTIGDPAGIGPEIVARLFAGAAPARSRALLIGAAAAWGGWREREGLQCPEVGSLEEATTGPASAAPVAVLDTGVEAPFSAGVESAGAGLHAGVAIEVACQLARRGKVAAIVTAPISKRSLGLAGFPFSGHTEMLAQLLERPHCQMMMVVGNLRVVPLTRHLPLREVAPRVTAAALEACLRETHAGLRGVFGIARPRIAVAGLNPHAGEGGVLGTDERDVIVPVLEALRTAGLDVTGPLSADAMFQEAYAAHVAGDAGARAYDAYVTMYHDQGLAPFKMIAQRRGVNVTIGLPVLRTSVDHGTALDIAGKGVASTESLHAAYALAEALCASAGSRAGAATPPGWSETDQGGPAGARPET